MKLIKYRFWVRQLIFLTVWFGSITVHGQNYWKMVSPNQFIADSSTDLHRFQLDFTSFIRAVNEKKKVSIPLDDHESLLVELNPCSNLSPGLAARYLGIRTVCGQVGRTMVNIDIADQVVHAFIIHQGKTYFIEPDGIYKNGYTLSRGNIQSPASAEQFSCKNQDTPPNLNPSNVIPFRSNPFQKTGMRTYRLALAVTGEFARTHGSTKEAVLVALNSHLSKINTVYRLEHGIQFQLVTNNDTLIFMDPESDPYINGNVNSMLEQNPKVLNQLIGLNNYDIGHVFGTNAGGVALLGSTCSALKGAGVSSTFGVYTGLQFYLIPCHEIGHQFSATHIFNFCDNENETSSSAFEPGSGSTIMSYAGASNCGANYVQGISDPYFHTFSLQQVRTYSRNGVGALCGTEIITSNEQPVSLIQVPVNIHVPILTPFELQGDAIDDTENTLTYTWEEMDLGQKSPLGLPSGTAPLFRSVPPDTSATRIFPRLNSILNNQSTITEVLPGITRPLNFRLTVRDNDIKGGGVHWSDLALQSIGQAGPFKISAFNTRDTLFRAGIHYFTWDVARTDQSPVNCKTVDIYLSEDGGLHFNTLLKAQTPNDGGEWVVLPDHPVSQLRIKIKGHEHVFFDINDASLTISPSLNTQTQIGIFPDRQTICAGSSGVFELMASASTSTDSLKINIINAGFPFVAITTSKAFISSRETLQISVLTDAGASPGLYVINLEVIDLMGTDTILLPFLVKIISNNIPLLSPANNENQVALSPVFKWKAGPFQDGFRIELAKDPGFTQVVWSRLILNDSTATPETELEGNTIYYWRLVPENGCGITKIPFVVFHTLALACKSYNSGDTPKFISATGTPTITSSLSVTDVISLKQIRIPSLTGSHEFVGDLEVSLRAPSGDSILLWSRQCNNLSNFNLALDDMAPIPISCPLTDRKAHQPVQSFNRLLNSTSTGLWTLSIRDAMNGAGGSLDGWTLELCGAQEGQGPKVNLNKPPAVVELKSVQITSSELSIIDPDSPAGSIKIQLLSDPSFGYLLKNGRDTLKLGSVFTQADVNAGLISYLARSIIQDTLDSILFLAFDEKNNWTGQQQFQIRIINDLSSPIQEESYSLPVIWYPNPAREFIQFENPGSKPAMVFCYTIDGKLIFSKRIEPWSSPHHPLLKTMEGIYILRFNVQNQWYSRKLIVLSD